MSQILNYGRTPVVPFKAKEGDISIVKTQTAAGTISGPSVASPLAKGAAVELDSEMTVKAYNSGLFIGFVYNEGKWVNGEPRTAMNQSAAVSADALREVMSIAGKKENKRIIIKFESFEITSKDEDTPLYLEVINENSNFMEVSNITDGLVSASIELREKSSA